jgi:hypothetical protein
VKLDPEKVGEAYALRVGGWSYWDIAEVLGVDTQTAQSMVTEGTRNTPASFREQFWEILGKYKPPSRKIPPIKTKPFKRIGRKPLPPLKSQSRAQR